MPDGWWQMRALRNGRGSAAQARAATLEEVRSTVTAVTDYPRRRCYQHGGVRFFVFLQM